MLLGRTVVFFNGRTQLNEVEVIGCISIIFATFIYNASIVENRRFII